MPKNKVGPPKNQADFSSNWKKLQTTLQTQTKKRKAESPEHERKRRRLEEGDGHKKHDAKPVNGKHNGKQGAGSRKYDAKPVNGKHNGKPVQGTDLAKGKLADKPPEKNEIWFDDVDELLLERPVSGHQQGTDNDPLLLQNAVTHATKALAIDCEMVGVGKSGVESILARVSIVNQHGHCVYDKFVKPREKVTDFRTHVSGVRPYNLRDAEEFLVVQREVSDLLKGKILVGHAIHNDLRVLFLDHPRRSVRDTSRYKPFRQLFGGRNPSLKKLTAKVLGVSVQQGEHNSVQDAQAAMRLYMMHRKRWEHDLDSHHRGQKRKAAGTKKKDKTKKANVAGAKRKGQTKKVTFADVE